MLFALLLVPIAPGRCASWVSRSACLVSLKQLLHQLDMSGCLTAAKSVSSQLSDVHAFIMESKNVANAGDMRKLLDSVTRAMGFDSFSLVQHVKHFSRQNEKFLAVSNMGESWVDYFLEHKLHIHEPAYIACGHTGVGFRFEDMPSLITVTARHKKVHEAARKEGITDGFVVPLHIAGEATGSCTFVVRDNMSLPAGNLPMAQLIGSFAYEAARHLLRSGIVFVGRPPPASGPLPLPQHEAASTLTTRQLECVVLVARGKTDREIARILGVHEQTVTEHLNEARRRCGVSRRTELPIHALYHGHLSFADVLN